MPIYTYECQNCGNEQEIILNSPVSLTCSNCGRQMKRVLTAASIVITGNIGPKLRTRVNLDDELQRQGMKAPLFKSEEAKDKARWLLKKNSLG